MMWRATSPSAAVGLVLTLAVWGSVAALSPGYDDEFFNIRWALAAIEEGGLQSHLAHASADPVHPTGSYLLGFGLFTLLGDWSLVRLVKAVGIAALLFVLLGRLVPALRGPGPDLRVLVLLSPSLLLWCTGLRWFGEFTVLLTALVALDRLVLPSSRFFWPILAAGMVLLVHVSYLGLVLGPVVLGFHLVQHRPRPGWPIVAALPILAAGSWHPVMAVAGTDHGAQRGTLLQSFVGTAHGVLVNHGLFPLSPEGLVTLAGTAALLCLVVLLRFRRFVAGGLGPLAVALIAAIALAGLGKSEKFRNVTPVLPIVFGVALASALRSGSEGRAFERWALRSATAVFLSTNFLGLNNVILHRNTAKGSWNLPVAATLRAVEDLRTDCRDPLAVTWDPVLEYHLVQAGVSTASLSSSESDGLSADDVASHGCVLVIETNPGSSRGAPFFSAGPLGEIVLRLGPDRHHAAKVRLDPLFPDHYVTIRRLDAEAAAGLAHLFALSPYGDLGR